MNAGIREKTDFCLHKKKHIKTYTHKNTERITVLKKLFFADYIQILILIKKDTSLNVFDKPSKKENTSFPICLNHILF